MKSLEAIHAHARAELDRQPRARRWWVDAAVLAAVNATSIVVSAFALAPSSARASMARWVVGALLGVVAVGAGFLSLRPGRRVVVWASGVAVLVAMGAAVVLGVDGTGSVNGLRCATAECVVSLVPALTALWALTRFNVDALRTAVAVGAAGAGGVLALHLHCPSGAWEHLVFFHVVPWLGLVALAVGVRQRLTSNTFAP